MLSILGVFFIRDIQCRTMHVSALSTQICFHCPAALEVVDHRIIRDGKEEVVRMMAQAYINHKGHEVKVGSGWNQEQRIRYQKNPSELIGKTITVQYFEESKNQQGGLSLRFPTVKHVFENGRNC